MVVCVLGCGPAGLFAAQAVQLAGHTPVIISKKHKSEIRGAQFLHKPIPGLTPPTESAPINIERIGTEPNYARRVYGDENAVTSWRKLPTRLDGWDLRATYDHAWRQFEASITPDAVNYDDVVVLSAEFPLVISTIPLWAICNGSHKFASRDILVSHSRTPLNYLSVNYIVYNGEPISHWSDRWYRRSRIFGHKSVETMLTNETLFDHERGGPKWEAGYKVVGTDCDCHPTVVRAGRHGRWERGVLTHHAFETAIEACHEHVA